jgi:hypothetical protein
MCDNLHVSVTKFVTSKAFRVDLGSISFYTQRRWEDVKSGCEFWMRLEASHGEITLSRPPFSFWM